jgi:hypothetical protein
VGLYTITSGQQFGAVSRRMTAFGMHLPDATVQAGMEWYPSVHEMVGQQSPDVGVTPSRGAGIVSAVSPNMDFESSNIKALEQIGNISSEGWEMIHRSASRRYPTGHQFRGRQMPRIPEVGAMLTETAPALSAAYDSGLSKAHRILTGSEWRDVIDPTTAAKTHMFASNIENPANDSVTIDGRSADVVANKRRDWKESRGVETARLKSGKETRYETHERVHNVTARTLHSLDPRWRGATGSDVQAGLWLAGQQIERSQPTKSGAPRVQGEARVGQPYVTPSGQPLERDSRFWDQA